jgi:hypothetical protein
MNYKVEDLSTLTHADDLISGFVDPDEITYGTNGNKTPISRIPTSYDSGEMPDLPPEMRTSGSNGGGGGFSMDDIDPELVNAAISTTGTLIGMAANSNRKSEVEQHLKATCGRRPRIGKGRKEAYRQCANQALQTLMGFNQGMGRGQGGWDNQNQGGWGQPPRQGMSTGAVIGIVAGVVVVGALVVVATRPKAS